MAGDFANCAHWKEACCSVVEQDSSLPNEIALTEAFIPIFRYQTHSIALSLIFLEFAVFKAQNSQVKV